MFKKLILLAACLLAAPAMAQVPPEKIVDTRLVADSKDIASGQKFRIGILMDPKEGWHTYWENPGDAGTPTVLKWALPDGFTNSEIDWPMPVRIVEGPLAVYGYPWPMLLPVTVTAPADLKLGEYYTFKVKAQWLACKDICIPESSELELTLRAVLNAAASDEAQFFDMHEQHAPTAISDAGSYSEDSKTLTVLLPITALPTDDIRSATFFPREENLIHYAAEQTVSVDKDNFHLAIERASGNPEGKITGLLSLKSGTGQYHNYAVSFAPAPSAIAAIIAPSATAQPGALSFFVVLLLAILGGLVLNLMPCVLPVLSLKALSIAKKSARERKHVVRQGVAYTLGILVTFALFSGTLLALRDGGSTIGWGYQMQSPAFVGFLIYLLFLVGLNLSGVFELPVLFGNVGNDVANENSAKGSFFTGVLAVAVATPCTAPFMATAVGAALNLPAWQAMMVFECLGLGLALPFLLISIFPKALCFLPKPGMWMVTFKEVLAFPMYASVIWLLWVLTLQTGAGGMAVALTGMLCVIAVIWMESLFTNKPTLYKIVSLAIFVLVFAVTLPMLSRMEISHDMAKDVEHISYSKSKLDELRADGKPVFIDATAAWCITCQVNATVAIHTQRTMKAFMDKGITFMQADWTQRNQEVTEFLSEFGYSGVPLVVYYPPDHAEPVILPQLLTEDIVLNAISGN